MDREKVIKGLNICVPETKDDSELECSDCPYGDVCNPNDIVGITLPLIFDIRELLKEQEPKVLTVDQLEDALDTVVWLETPVSENLADGYSLIMAYSHKYGYMIFDSPFGDNPSQDKLEYSEYGKSWRCWDKRPTDEQRQAVKWE